MSHRNSLAGQMQLGCDAILPKQGDKHVGICARSADVSRDGHHLIHCQGDKPTDTGRAHTDLVPHDEAMSV